MKKTDKVTNKIKTLQELNLEDDFLFARVMEDEELCKELLEKILNVKIKRIEIVQPQRSINVSLIGRGIRLDIYLKDDENSIYNVEIQKINSRNLPLRTRYYQGNIDLDTMLKGSEYNQLPKSFIIFICTFDYFGLGRHLYTFENRCIEDLGLPLGDNSQKIILNSRGTLNDVSEEVKDFLRYVEHTTPELAENSHGTLVKNIQRKVELVKSNKGLEVEYMTFEEKVREERADAARDEAEQVAKNLKEAGVDISIIAKCTGLTVDEVKDL